MSRYDIKNHRLVVLPGLLLGLLTAPFMMTLARAGELDNERWYQVELIVFAQRDKSAVSAEQWPQISDSHLPAGLTELAYPPAPLSLEPEIISPISLPAPDTLQVDNRQLPDPALATIENGFEPLLPKPFEILRADEMQLGKAMQKLKQSGRHEPLLHVAWRQPTYERSKTQAVLLYEGVDTPLQGQPQTTPPDLNSLSAPPSPDTGDETPMAEALLPPAPRLLTEADTRIGPPNPRFVGSVKISVARYLHLDADLLYRALIEQQTVLRLPDHLLWDEQPYPTLREPQGPAYSLQKWHAVRGFRLEESRRMRSGEMHYLDHPFFGLIVLVTPFELPKIEEQEMIPAPTKILQ